MKDKKQRMGVALYHLKNRFAFGTINGSEMTKFKFNKKQVSAIMDFLQDGVFQGMFDVAEFGDYQDVAELDYLGLSREAESLEIRKNLESERKHRVSELEEMHKDVVMKSTQSQPQ